MGGYLLKPSDFDYHELCMIQKALKSQEVQTTLRHCKTIHVPQLAVVMEKPECVRLPLVRSLLEEPHNSQFMFRRIKMLVNGCLHVSQGKQHMADLWSCLSRCQSVSELQEVYEQLNLEYNERYVQQKAKMEEEGAAQAAFLERLTELDRQQNRRAQSEKKALAMPDPKFPQPPFPGNEFIKPITTPGGLRYESSSKVMDNCVGGMEYMNRVANGEIYI